MRVVLVLIAFVERHHPTDAESDEEIGVLIVHHAACGYVVTTPVARETLREFEPTKEIEQFGAALKVVTDEFLKDDAVGKPIEAFFVRPEQLRHVIAFGMVAYPMLHETATKHEHETAVRIGSCPWEDLAHLQIYLVALLRNVDIRLFARVGNDEVA